MKIGKLFGIEIILNWSLFILLGLLIVYFWTQFSAAWPATSSVNIGFFSVSAAVLLIASLLLHEFGHSLVGKKCGLNFKSITLFFFGGIAGFTDDLFVKGPQTELKMAVAGPMVSFLLAALFFLLKEVTGGLWQNLNAELMRINFLLGVFNLLPAFPLDGGRILRSLIWWKSGNFARATKISRWTGIFVGSIGFPLFIFLIGGGIFNIIFAVFIFFFLLLPYANQEYRSVQIRETLGGLRAEEAMRPAAGMNKQDAIAIYGDKAMFCGRNDNALAVLNNLMANDKVMVIFVLDKNNNIVGKFTS